MDDFIFIESLEAQMQAQGDKNALVSKEKKPAMRNYPACLTRLQTHLSKMA